MKSAGPILRFGSFELDRDRRRLTRGTARVWISDRHIAMLTEPVSNANAVVLKDTLPRVAWPDIDVNDNTIVQAVKALRGALKSRPNGPVFIETIVGKDYRFNADIESASPAQPLARLEPLLAPHDVFVSGRIALEMLDRNRIALASQDLEAKLTEHPEVATTHIALANVDYLTYESTRIDAAPDVARLEKALRHASRGCELSPHSGDAWGVLGLTRHRSGDTSGGLSAVRKAIDLEPTPFMHYVRLALVSWGDERLVATDRALKRCPELAVAHWLAATVFVARGSFDLALDRLRIGCAL
ncbi:MAG: winged helix-turn-helix domain-containing protein [Vicinamibacterales bacterium]